MNEDNDVMLPEGWTEGSDIFAQPENTAAPAVETPHEDNADGAPTTEPAAPTTGQTPPAAETEETKADSLAPTTGQSQPAPAPSEAAPPQDGGKLRFTAKVDRSDVDVELDPKELPSIYQRAQVTDRFQQKVQQLQPKVDKAEQLARTLGYADLDDMVAKAEGRFRDTTVERLTARGVDKEVAEAVADSKLLAGRTGRAEPSAPQAAPAAGRTGGVRDFVSELAALRQVYPNAGADGKLPDEVVNAAAREGKPLVTAYAAWDAKQQAAETDRLRREVEVLRQNQQNTSKAPVTGTAGGGDTGQKTVDDFLRGFGD